MGDWSLIGARRNRDIVRALRDRMKIWKRWEDDETHQLS